MTNKNDSARANILAKLKQQVAGADYDKLPIETPFQYPKLTANEQQAQFIEHLENNHAQVIKTTREAISNVVEHELKKREILTLLYGENSEYSSDIQALDKSIELTPYREPLDGRKPWLFNEVPASICGAKCAIARTGSIVLWPTVDEPRSLSLVPPVHFVIVDAKTMYSDFATLIKAQRWQQQLPTNALLISGPSKTADIQQTLAYGAHGPKELIVLLVDG